MLGRIQYILEHELEELRLPDLYAFLEDGNAAYVAAQPGLASLIQRAIVAAQAYEAQHKVTYGVIWGDAMEIRREEESGRIGVIDWGTIAYGPQLFDVALTALWLFPEGSGVYDEFLQAYLREAPIEAGELEGLKHYKALLWARQAKYFAYRVGANVMLGDADPEGNEKSLAESREALERLLEG